MRSGLRAQQAELGVRRTACLGKSMRTHVVLLSAARTLLLPAIQDYCESHSNLPYFWADIFAEEHSPLAMYEKVEGFSSKAETS